MSQLPIPNFPIRTAAVAFLMLAVAPAQVSAQAGTTACFDGSPAMPVEQFRTISGQGTFELWPENLEPAEPIGQALPVERDSTNYNGFGRPGLQGGNELFWGLDIVDNSAGTFLFTAYNAGFHVWDIGAGFETAPQLLSQRDGWVGDFNSFEDLLTEEYFKNWDIAAIDPTDSPGATLVALAGEGPVGPTIWDAADKANPVQLYQDTGKVGEQVAAANIGGRSYAFFALNNGVHVYDMTRAREIGPCFESTSQAINLCGGNSNAVWRGRIADWPWSRADYVDVLETEIDGETRHFLVASDGFFDFTIGDGLGVEVREIDDITALPPANTPLVEGLHTSNLGVEIFEVAESGGLQRFYVATVNTDGQTSSGLLQIYDITACIAPGSVPGEICSFSIANRRYSKQLGDLPSAAYLHFSRSNGRPFLYQSHHTLCSLPPETGENDIEHLLDLNGLATGDPIVDIRGESYLDPNHAGPSRRIDYWSSYYDQATDGFSGYSPHGGLFRGSYFYRVTQTMVDVHVLDTEPTAAVQATSGDRWLSSPAVEEWVDLSGDCNLDAGTGWSYSATNAPGTPVEDPDPVVEGLGADLARVRRGLCGTDTYPAAICPSESVLVEADVTCGGTPLTSDELALTLDDPRPFFDTVEILESPLVAGPPPVYEVEQTLSFQAMESGLNQIGGKALTSFQWSITVASRGVALVCDDVSADPGLNCTETSLTWDTTGQDVGEPAGIFFDGFESGDTTAWSGGARGPWEAFGIAPGEGVTFDVTLSATNDHDTIDRTVQLTLVPIEP